MLTSDLIRPRLRRVGDELRIEWLPLDRETRQIAADLIAGLDRHVGHSLATWQDWLERYEGERTDYTIIRGLAKVLIDAATVAPVETAMDPVELRARLFSRGPTFATADLFHPRTRTDILRDIAAELELTVEQIEQTLYADRVSAAIIRAIDEAWTPETLIARYNLELARGALYWARELRIDIHDNYKDFWRYLKLFKLMFWAVPLPGGGYHVTLDGPISPFVHATLRYGRQFAGFLPAVLLGQQWRFVADVRHPQSGDWLRYPLDPATPLVSHFKRSGAFDSRFEADFAAGFAAKFGDERGRWQLSREDEVLLLGDTVFIPDFALTHKQDGRRALIEIVGFWHPRYLQRKLMKVREAGRRNLILLVYEGVNLTGDKLLDIPAEVLYFANKPVLKDVLAAVERVAE